MTTSQTILHLRSMFSRHGFPDEIVTDNGTQFSSRELAAFARKHSIKHVTSSPLFSQGNGMAERSVQTAKHLIHSSPDSYAALLAYQARPLENGYSPAQLLYSRQLRTDLPITIERCCPKVPDFSAIAAREEKQKQRQKRSSMLIIRSTTALYGQ